MSVTPTVQVKPSQKAMQATTTTAMMVSWATESTGFGLDMANTSCPRESTSAEDPVVQPEGPEKKDIRPIGVRLARVHPETGS